MFGEPYRSSARPELREFLRRTGSFPKAALPHDCFEIAEKIRAATGVPHIRIHGAPSRDPERVEDVVACLDLPQEQLTHDFKAQACRALAPWEVPRQWRIEKAPAAGC